MELHLDHAAAVDRLVEIDIQRIGFQEHVADAAILVRLIDQHAEGQALFEKDRTAPLLCFAAQLQFRRAFDEGFASDRLTVAA